MRDIERRLAAVEAAFLPAPAEDAALARALDRLGRAGDLARLRAVYRTGGLRALWAETPEVGRAVFGELVPDFGPIAGAPWD